MDVDAETRWLPSFVLPTDPAIDQLRQRALPALRALDDTFGEVPRLPGRSVKDNPRYRRVDVQVNAIWSTLSFLYELSYVNPPPIYTERAQRLRTPTAVARSQSGHASDLALLFAACLEAIDLYPVILIYEGHANVGTGGARRSARRSRPSRSPARSRPARRSRDWKPKRRAKPEDPAMT